MIKIRAKEYTLDYLLNLSEKPEKMENLHCTDLEMQNYPKDAEIPVADFDFRVKFLENSTSNCYPMHIAIRPIVRAFKKLQESFLKTKDDLIYVQKRRNK